MGAEESQRPEMAMAGMAMPETAGDSSTNQPMVSSALQSMPGHAVLAEMGACMRQSCDQAQALASKANHSTAGQFETVSTIAGFFQTENLRAAFHEARGGIAPLTPIVRISEPLFMKPGEALLLLLRSFTVPST